MNREQKKQIALKIYKKIKNVYQEFNQNPYEINICWDECLWIDDEFFNYTELSENEKNN